jgi:hypothetical protein
LPTRRFSEALFMKERELTAERLVELDRADTATLAKLFGISAPPSAEQPPVSCCRQSQGDVVVPSVGAAVSLGRGAVLG